MNEIKITGLRELNDKLAKLADDVAMKYARGAVAAAAKVVKKAAENSAPTQSGKLRSAVYSMWMPSESNRERQTFFVSVRSGKKAQSRKTKKGMTKDKDAYYWKWVEFGHLALGPGKRLKGGAVRRKINRERAVKGGARTVPAKHFMQNAFESNRQRAIDAFKAELEKRLFYGLKK